MKERGPAGTGTRGGRVAARSATALARYARLEASGEYRDGTDARAEDVIVSFGRATLTLSRPDDTPVAHWALAGLRRLDGPAGDDALRLAPDADSDERLVLRDPTMVEAIRAVCADLEAGPPPSRGWLRLVVWGLGAAGALAGLVLVVLPVLADALAPLTPPERERRLGEAVMARLAPMLGPEGECTAPRGRAALDRLTARLTPEADLPFPPVVRVWRFEAVNAIAAPGGQVALPSGLIDLARTPEHVAAVLAHEFGHVSARDPLREALRATGAAGVLTLLSGRALGGAATTTMAEAALATAPSRDAEETADRYAHTLLGRSGLPSSALAAMFDRFAADGGGDLVRHFASHSDLGARAAAARAADVIGDDRFRPALSDADWIALRQICD